MLPLHEAQQTQYTQNPMSFGYDKKRQESYLEPLFLWRPEYDTDPEALKAAVLKICAMLDSSCYFYNRWGNRNKIENFDIFNGIVDGEKYRNTTHVFGDSFPSDVEPFDFFSSPVNVLVGELTADGMKFSVEVVNREAAERDIERRAKMAAQAVVRNGMSMASEEVGEDLSFLQNRKQYIPGSEQEMANFLNEKSENESVVYDMMQATILKYNIEHELSRSFKDRAIINSEFGEVYIRNGDPCYRRLHPSNVSWLGGGDDIETLEDCDAVCSYRYSSFSEIIIKHGHKLEEAQGWSKFSQLIKDVVKDGQGDWGRLQGGWQKDGTVVVNYPMMPHHYRFNGVNGIAISEQNFYIKFVKQKRYKMTQEGKPLDKDTYRAIKQGELWRIKDFDSIRYEPMADKDKEKAGDTIKTIPYIELWTGTKIGSEFLIDLRPYELQNRKQENRVNISFPIKGKINHEPSMVTKGLPIYNMFMRIMFQLQRQVNLSGLKTVFVDASQMPKDWDINTFLYSAKAVGLGVFNSQQVSGNQNPNLANKHLTTVDWGLNDDITKLLQLATLMWDLYAQVSGVALSRQGFIKKGEGVGQSEQAQVQSSLITQPMFFEHGIFVREVLQEMADLGRHLWAKDESKSVIIGKWGKKVLMLSSKLKLDEYGIFVTDSYRDRRDKEFLMRMAESALSTASISFKEMIKMYYSDNPSEVEAIFDEGMSRMEKIEADNRAAQNQTAQQKVEVDAQKINVPIEVAKINAGAIIEAKKMELEYRGKVDSEGMDYKTGLADIKNQQQLDVLHEQQAHDAAMAENEAVQGAMGREQQGEQQVTLEMMKQFLNAKNSSGNGKGK